MHWVTNVTQKYLHNRGGIIMYSMYSDFINKLQFSSIYKGNQVLVLWKLTTDCPSHVIFQPSPMSGSICALTPSSGFCSVIVCRGAYPTFSQPFSILTHLVITCMSKELMNTLYFIVSTFGDDQTYLTPCRVRVCDIQTN